MENNRNRDYGQNDRNPQQNQTQNYQSQKNRDNIQAHNANNAAANPQRSPQNGRDSNVPDSASGSDAINKLDLEIGHKMDEGYEYDEDALQSPNDFDDSVEDNDLIPNTGEADEADQRKSKDNIDLTRTPGL